MRYWSRIWRKGKERRIGSKGTQIKILSMFVFAVREWEREIDELSTFFSSHICSIFFSCGGKEKDPFTREKWVFAHPFISGGHTHCCTQCTASCIRSNLVHKKGSIYAALPTFFFFSPCNLILSLFLHVLIGGGMLILIFPFCVLFIAECRGSVPTYCINMRYNVLFCTTFLK